MTRNLSSISAAGPCVVRLDLPLPVAIFVGLSAYAVLSGVLFLAGGLVCRLVLAVLQ